MKGHRNQRKRPMARVSCRWILFWVLIFSHFSIPKSMAQEDRPWPWENRQQIKSYIEHLISLYYPQLRDRYQLPVVLNFPPGGFLAQPILQATAVRREQNVEITFYSGLLDPQGQPPGTFKIDRGILSFIACHEIGHLEGGVENTQYPLPLNATEGEADYFATAKCLKRVFSELGTKDLTHEESMLSLCSQVYPSRREQLLCAYSIQAAKKAFALIYRTPFNLDFSNDDFLDALAEVPVTNFGYPTQECRLVSAIRGALCYKSPDLPMDFTDEAQGACMPGISEREDWGIRPKCWYAY